MAGNKSIQTMLVGMPKRSRSRYAALSPQSVSLRRSKRNITQLPKDTLLIVHDRNAMTSLLRQVADCNRPLGSAILQDEPAAESLSVIHSLFRPFMFIGPHSAILPDDELVQALTADNQADLAIAANIDPTSELLAVMRGDLTTLTVPLSSFIQSTAGPKPDFNDFHLTDFGQTLQFGEYEAAFDALLYEHDELHRRRINKKRQQSAKGLGPSLQRLRQQKRLTREDFAPTISAKTIARIEQGKTKSTAKTIHKIADILDVKPEDIETY